MHASNMEACLQNGNLFPGSDSRQGWEVSDEMVNTMVFTALSETPF